MIDRYINRQMHHTVLLHKPRVKWFCSDLLSYCQDTHGKYNVNVTLTYFSDSSFLERPESALDSTISCIQMSDWYIRTFFLGDSDIFRNIYFPI